MTNNTTAQPPPSEDNPDKGCTDCGDPHCPNAALSMVSIRALVDEEGEEYIHVDDLHRAMRQLITVQEDASVAALADVPKDSPQMSLALERARCIDHGMEALLRNTTVLIHDPKRRITVPKAEDLPDMVPTEWGQDEQGKPDES